MTLGEKIKEARRQAGLTQEQLADKLSVSRPAVAKWETDKGLPDVGNLKALASLLSVSVDYLLGDEDGESLLEIREPVRLEDYQKNGRCRSREDAVVVAKYPSADAIWPLVRRKNLTKAEWVLDFFTSPGVFEIADRFKNRSFHYLVEQNGMQYLVSVSREFITSRRVVSRIAERKFTIGNYRFVKADYRIDEKN